MTCNKFIKAGGCNYPGNVRQIQRTFGNFVDSNFAAIFIGAQAKHKVTSQIDSLHPSARQLQQGLPSAMEIVSVTAPFHGPLCARTLPPFFVSQGHSVGALTSDLLWKFFRLVREGIWLMLSHRCQSPGVVSARPVGQRAARR